MSENRATTRDDLRKIIEITDQRIYELKPHNAERFRFTNLWPLVLLTGVRAVATGASAIVI